MDLFHIDNVQIPQLFKSNSALVNDTKCIRSIVFVAAKNKTGSFNIDICRSVAYRVPPGHIAPKTPPVYLCESLVL